jgi:hypothetical protein
VPQAGPQLMADGTGTLPHGAAEKKKNVRTYFIRPGIGLDARTIS